MDALIRADTTFDVCSRVDDGHEADPFRPARPGAAQQAAVAVRADPHRLPQSARIVGRAVLQRAVDFRLRHRRPAGHRQRSGPDPLRAGRQCQELQARHGAPEDPAADPARRPADCRGHGVAALAQGDGAGVHAAPHLRLRRADAEMRRGVCAALRRGDRHHGRRVARHDDADLRDPRRDAVLRRDRRPARRFRARDRPLVRDHGPRRSARPAARARLAAARHALARPQDHGLLPPYRRGNDGDAKAAPRARSRRRAGGLPHAAAAHRGPGRADLERDRRQHHHLHRGRPRNHRTGAGMDHLPARRGAHGSATASRRRSTPCCRASPIRSNGST